MTKLTKCFIIISALMLVGCVPADPEKTEADKVVQKLKGEARIALFKECLAAASKITRQSDDDVSEIISECGTSSYYLTNYMVK